MGSASEGKWQVLIGVRQAASLSFLMVVIMTLFSSASYLAGRVVTASEQAKAKRQAPRNVVVVDGPKVCPESPAPPITPVVTSIKPPAQPIAGRTYLQVGAVDRGIAEVFAEYLARKNLPTAVGAVDNGKAYRVLVGPLDSDAEIASARARLEEAGFQSFVKKYPESTAKREAAGASTPGGAGY